MTRTADRITTLCDLCAGLFAFVVELQAGPVESKAAEPPRYDATTARARELLAQLDAAGREHGFAKETVDQAKYAIVALLDEVVLASRWAMREEWLRRPLAAELFAEFNAGEEFFKRLENLGRGGRLGADTVAVLEVHATCLSLGFKGMHIDASGAERLREILWSVSRRINEGRETTPLAPHWEQKESVARSVGRLPTWLIVAAGLAVIGLLHGISELLTWWNALDVGQTLRDATR
ncbi:MAG: DotU family type IV/VI secretion system protein [Planctomycetes bacterium]|nr:DotU family type IV/VI secretion system protein [Planctomycetota bacterium]